MDNKNILPFSYRLIIVFVFVIYPVEQPGTLQEADSFGPEEAGAAIDETDHSETLAVDVREPSAENGYARVGEDLKCLALNIYFEARSEPPAGRRAVGHVVMNRVNNTRFPDSICDVVRQGGFEKLNQCQFSWWCDGRPDKPYNHALWLKALQLAFEIYRGESTDPTGGALWYHADSVSPSWSRSYQRGPKIGHHVFYRESRPKSKVL
ncbi:MAG: cell wall hydrolase [Gammaproteobacteria bacterium]